MLSFLFAAASIATAFAQAPSAPPDLPPDATGAEYRTALRNAGPSAAADSLDEVLAAGERNLQLLDHLNETRPAGKKLSLTSAEATRAFPPESPHEYSPAIILTEFRARKAALPAALAAIVLEGAAFPDGLPVDEKIYLEQSRELDRVYQSAARWRMLARFLGRYSKRRAEDIRGYYFLSRLDDRAAKLKDPAAPARAQYGEWLVGMCFNDFWSSLSYCRRTVGAAVAAGADLGPLYAKWEAKSRSLYEANFAIPPGAPRSEFRSEAARFLAPFTDPGSDEIRHFLKDNIEDEWRVGDWHLELPFVTANGHASILFAPDVTPNVNGLGGNRITMNSKQPLSEYDAQETIRHEFGHVLGFPDCYVEFFDDERGVMVNYQIDVTNIMCSRRGHVLTTHVDELRRAYAR